MCRENSNQNGFPYISCLSKWRVSRGRPFELFQEVFGDPGSFLVVLEGVKSSSIFRQSPGRAQVERATTSKGKQLAPGGLVPILK